MLVDQIDDVEEFDDSDYDINSPQDPRAALADQAYSELENASTPDERRAVLAKYDALDDKSIAHALRMSCEGYSDVMVMPPVAPTAETRSESDIYDLEEGDERGAKAILMERAADDEPIDDDERAYLYELLGADRAQRLILSCMPEALD